jgi:hypothetical protein
VFFHTKKEKMNRFNSVAAGGANPAAQRRSDGGGKMSAARGGGGGGGGPVRRIDIEEELNRQAQCVMRILNTK